MFNASEIDTAVRHNKQIVVVVGNDCQWGMVNLMHLPKEPFSDDQAHTKAEPPLPMV